MSDNQVAIHNEWGKLLATAVNNLAIVMMISGFLTFAVSTHTFDALSWPLIWFCAGMVIHFAAQDFSRSLQ
jgi:hypothetical protein